ncbi:MAG: LPS export ABC transporter periplasmic protein LptC [Planctomycetes bacterium]|nr:LPS export ABC transporter periplasmic protein LptC [Planctomycetota bacterium]
MTVLRRWALIACALLPAAGASPAAAEVGANIKEITGVEWPQFDRKTGRKILVVKVDTAASGDGMTFEVEKVAVDVYGGEYNIKITSDSGVVNRRDRRNFTFTLKGNVTIRIADPARTLLTAEKLEWVAADHVLLTDTPVEVRRTDFTVKGVGLEMRPEEGTREVRFIKLSKDVQAEISPRTAASAVFSGLTGKARPADRKEEDAPPMFISSKGAMTINRDTNSVSFEENVVARRGTFTIRADKLEMTFDPEKRKVTTIIGTGNVSASDGKNGASGDTLSWDASTGLVEMAGNPAKTWRAKATVSAGIIWFSQDNGQVLWSGDAHIHAPPEGPNALMRFGGASE